MAIPGAPSDSGTPLADLFGGVNRPQLNAFVANSQARNGLVSAQTQDAMIKASQAQEQMAAWDRIKADFVAKGASDSDATLARDGIVAASNHDAVNAENLIKAGNSAVLGNPALMGSVQQTAAQQGYQGKVAEPVALPNNFTTLNGTPPITGQQSAQGAAQTQNVQAQAALRDLQVSHPQLFHPNAMGVSELDPNVLNFEGYKYYKTNKMPALGRDNAPLRSGIMAVGAQLAQREANGEDITNPAFDTAIQNGQDFTASGRALNSYAGGSLGDKTRYINNLAGHLQLMDTAFTALQNGDQNTLSSLKNRWQKEFGSPLPTNVQTAAEVIGPELAKALAGNTGAGTQQERQAFSATVGNLANAPEQTGGAIATLKDMLGTQMSDLEFQYHGATNGRTDFQKRYVPDSVTHYLGLTPPNAPMSAAAPPAGGGGPPPLGSQPPTGGAPAPQPGTPQTPVTIKSDADYNALPSGTHFIGPDNHMRIKP